MFSLMHGLWSYMFSKTEFHVLILGIDKAGKTVLFFCSSHLKTRFISLTFLFGWLLDVFGEVEDDLLNL